MSYLRPSSTGGLVPGTVIQRRVVPLGSDAQTPSTSFVPILTVSDFTTTIGTKIVVEWSVSSNTDGIASGDNAQITTTFQPFGTGAVQVGNEGSSVRTGNSGAQHTSVVHEYTGVTAGTHTITGEMRVTSGNYLINASSDPKAYHAILTISEVL